jgi:hypothetical protein
MKCPSCLTELAIDPHYAYQFGCCNVDCWKNTFHTHLTIRKPIDYYRLKMLFEDHLFVLAATNFTDSNFTDYYSHTALYRGNYQKHHKMIEIATFTPLPNDETMHEEAWKIFHRLKKMAVFS